MGRLFASQVYGRNLSSWTLIVFLAIASSVTSCQKQPSRSTGPPEKITFAYTTLPHSALFQIAFIKGFFLAEGLEVTPQPQAFGKLALASVLEGKADLATSADTPIMFAATGGKKVKTIAVIMTSSKIMAIAARKDRGIAAPLDLKGKTIGATLGTSGEFFMDSFFVANGIDRKEVKIIDMKPDEMLNALLKGRVAAVATWHPALNDIRKGLGDNGLLFYEKNVYSDNHCVTGGQEFVGKHPETIKKILKALIRAEAFVKQNPEESRRLVAEFMKADKALLDEIWNSFDFMVSLNQSLLISLEDQTRWAMKSGLAEISSMPNYLDYLYLDGLAAVKPEAVGVIR